MKTSAFGALWGTVLIACVCGLMMSLAVAAPRSTTAGGAGWDKLRADYRALVAADPSVTDLKKWEATASSIESYLKKAGSAAPKSAGLYLLGELYETTYRKRGFRVGLSKAVYYFEELAKRFTGDGQADDALLRLGALRADGLHDSVGARAAYFEIVDVYPKSNSAPEARRRLGLPPSVVTTPTPTPMPAGAAEFPTPVRPAATPSSAPSPSATGAGASAPGAAATPAPTIDPQILSDLKLGTSLKEGKGKELVLAESPRKVPIVVIDPGHGGDEHGAEGVDGVLEKNVVLNIAKELRSLLQDRLRATAVLTRDSDVLLPLEQRARLANDRGADLFISVHANASELHNAHGIETYYLDNTDDKSSLKLAQRENASLGGPSDDLGFMISDFIQSAKLPESISLAHHLQDSLTRTLSRYYPSVKNLGTKKAPFYVLVGAHMPCVLVEVSFIDHPTEGRRLGSSRYQRLVAESLYLGVREYFQSTGR